MNTGKCQNKWDFTLIRFSTDEKWRQIKSGDGRNHLCHFMWGWKATPTILKMPVLENSWAGKKNFFLYKINTLELCHILLDISGWIKRYVRLDHDTLWSPLKIKIFTNLLWFFLISFDNTRILSWISPDSLGFCQI